jgi:hypothetical protein
MARNASSKPDSGSSQSSATIGIEVDFIPEHADTFRRDLYPDLRADYVLANPHFNAPDWFLKDDDVHWQLGTELGSNLKN